MASRRDIAPVADVTKLEIMSAMDVEVMDQYAPGASLGEKWTRITVFEVNWRVYRVYLLG